MMRKFEFSTRRKDGSLRQLSDFLAVVNGGSFLWSIFEFDGVGVAPEGMSIDEFSDLVRKRPNGYEMKWLDLLKFADSLEQTYDCLIVAVQRPDQLILEKFERGLFDDVEFAVECFDISCWYVWSKNNVELNF